MVRRCWLVAVALWFICSMTAAQQKGRTYKVKKGDCLWVIAKKTKTTVYALKKTNHLTDKSILKPGQVIHLPLAHPVTRRAQARPKAASAKPVRQAAPQPNPAAREKHEETELATSVSEEQEVQAYSEHPMVQIAHRYRGARYRRGGATSRGFDCSGFVHFVLARQGIRAPRTAAQLFHFGTPIPKDQLQPGDLVFFRNTARRRGITHVGIYLGDGKFIHSSSARRGVIISRLDEGYYAKRFVGARRVR